MAVAGSSTQTTVRSTGKAVELRTNVMRDRRQSEQKSKWRSAGHVRIKHCSWIADGPAILKYAAEQSACACQPTQIVIYVRVIDAWLQTSMFVAWLRGSSRRNTSPRAKRREQSNEDRLNRASCRPGKKQYSIFRRLPRRKLLQWACKHS